EVSADETAALRLLTPLTKLMTAKQAVAVASEALEGFGGAGYVEDTGLPVWLRDAQVLPIWEGTTNVLSLDVLRAAQRDGAWAGWKATCQRRLEALAKGPLASATEELSARLAALETTLPRLMEERAVAEANARSLALHWAALAAALPLLEQAAWALAHGRGERSAWAAQRWLTERVPPLQELRRERLAEDAQLSGPGEEGGRGARRGHSHLPSDVAARGAAAGPGAGGRLAHRARPDLPRLLLPLSLSRGGPRLSLGGSRRLGRRDSPQLSGPALGWALGPLLRGGTGRVLRARAARRRLDGDRLFRPPSRVPRPRTRQAPAHRRRPGGLRP